MPLTYQLLGDRFFRLAKTCELFENKTQVDESLWYKMEWNKMEWNGIKWNGNGMKWKMGHGVEFKNHLRILSSKFTN